MRIPEDMGKWLLLFIVTPIIIIILFGFIMHIGR
jgi:hypothetical protein